MTASPSDRRGAQRRSSKETQEEVARSLERELSLLAEERRERALRLGLDLGATTKTPD